VNETHQFLVSANTEAMIDASNQFALEVNAEKTKCILVSSQQNSAQNHVVDIANRSFENMCRFKIFGKEKFNRLNACGHYMHHKF
jgi:hypothetical protein